MESMHTHTHTRPTANETYIPPDGTCTQGVPLSHRLGQAGLFPHTHAALSCPLAASPASCTPSLELALFLAIEGRSLRTRRRVGWHADVRLDLFLAALSRPRAASLPRTPRNPPPFFLCRTLSQELVRFKEMHGHCNVPQVTAVCYPPTPPAISDTDRAHFGTTEVPAQPVAWRLGRTAAPQVHTRSLSVRWLVGHSVGRTPDRLWRLACPSFVLLRALVRAATLHHCVSWAFFPSSLAFCVLGEARKLELLGDVTIL
eukprot:2478113-Rhodomonas_salina.2